MPPALTPDSWQYPMPPPAFLASTPYQQVPSPIPQHSSVDKSPVDLNRYRKWRHEKSAIEDQVLAARGEPPKKRNIKEDYHYQCKTCGQSKRKNTGHTQLKGKWYCPASGQTIAEWKGSLDKQ
ncbi:hypothetical protein OYC64_000612 [Pagothenia borchgrevinki]|uniref:Uncharacterized protein n=1 Tax=Pagothenia borchgrevinki TaxID=8213 RepID=A0ABD2HEB4_PAGBO